LFRSCFELRQRLRFESLVLGFPEAPALPHSLMVRSAQPHVQLEEIGVLTNSATDRNGASEMPTQPIAVAYFNRTPVAIDQYLCRERSVNFFSFAAAVALIAAAILLALD
jgi:hypothetical protein